MKVDSETYRAEVVHGCAIAYEDVLRRWRRREIDAPTVFQTLRRAYRRINREVLNRGRGDQP